MSTYATDNQIMCENCDKFFVAYAHIQTEFDLDVPHKEISDSYEEKLNRITCPFCMQDFTYETDILFYSFINKFAVYCSCKKMFLEVANFRTAMKICGFDNWDFRVCTYSYEAFEKIRILTVGLDDAKINLLKAKKFPQYRNMNPKDEYISFESCDDTTLYFSHRDFTGKVLEKLSVCREDYNSTPDLQAEKGNWVILDKEWTINKLEELK